MLRNFKLVLCKFSRHAMEFTKVIIYLVLNTFIFSLLFSGFKEKDKSSFTYLSLVVGGNAAHVVMDCRQNGDGFASDVDASKDHRSLRNAGQTSGEILWGQVVKLQENVILVGSAAATLSDLDGHAAGHHVPGRQVLQCGI